LTEIMDHYLGDRRYRLNVDEIPVVLELVRLKLLELIEAREDLDTAGILFRVLYETIKDVCEALQIPYDTVAGSWLPKARKLSPKVKELVMSAHNSFSDFHARILMKYPHSVQDSGNRNLPNNVVRLKDYSRRVRPTWDGLSSWSEYVKPLYFTHLISIERKCSQPPT